MRNAEPMSANTLWCLTPFRHPIPSGFVLNAATMTANTMRSLTPSRRAVKLEAGSYQARGWHLEWQLLLPS